VRKQNQKQRRIPAAGPDLLGSLLLSLPLSFLFLHDLVCRIIILPIIFPETDLADLKAPSLIEGQIAAARTPAT